jgi:hypothetical protein
MSVDIQERLVAALDSRRGGRAPDSLCETYVDSFSVDAATISMIFDGSQKPLTCCVTTHTATTAMSPRRPRV